MSVPACSHIEAMASAHRSPAPSLHFELDCVESSLQQMDVAMVSGDDEVAVGPLRVFISADQNLQGELFEDVIVAA